MLRKTTDSKRVCANSTNRHEQMGRKKGRGTHSTHTDTAGIQKSSQTDNYSPPTESCSSSLKPYVTISKPRPPPSHNSTYTPCLRERRKRCTPRRGLPGLMFRIPRSPKPGLTFGRIRNRNRIGAPFHMRRYDMCTTSMYPNIMKFDETVMKTIWYSYSYDAYKYVNIIRSLFIVILFIILLYCTVVYLFCPLPLYYH